MEQVLGMRFGADDCVVEPFSGEILLAKIEAVLRRVKGTLSENEHGVLRAGNLRLNSDNLMVCWGEFCAELTKNEVCLLRLLVKARGNFVRRETLFEELCDEAHFVDENTLSVNVTRVKSKLTLLCLQDAVTTKRGLGYYLDMSRLEEKP